MKFLIQPKGKTEKLSSNAGGKLAVTLFKRVGAQINKEIHLSLKNMEGFYLEPLCG